MIEKNRNLKDILGAGEIAELRKVVSDNPDGFHPQY